MKLSQWHDGSVKPVHVGVYQIKGYLALEYVMYSFFDGKYWRGWESEESFKLGDYPEKTSFIIYGQYREWRGIVKDKK